MTESSEAAAGITAQPRRSLFRNVLWWGTAAVLGLGLAVRLTVCDAVLVASTIFYATPLPVLTAGAAFLLLLDGVWGPRRRALFWLAVVLALGFWTYRKDWRWPPVEVVASRPAGESAHEHETLKLLFWNVARRENLEPAAEYIRQSDADIVGLVEASGDPQVLKQFWREQLPEYDVTNAGGGMYYLAKGTSGEVTGEKIAWESNLRQLRITVRGVEYHCFIADLGAHIHRLRKTGLEGVAKFADEHPSERVLVMGDFNTPPDSPQFARLRQHHRLLFEVVGDGYAPTWPVPLPVLQLDQIWVNQHLQPVLCWHGFSSASDHRPVHAIVRTQR
ncbi:endonuclease/exonuclease/phosphatase family protein [Planctomicrobium sp. SH664]|uniref:endonuclease/exonuclease/phosphatase family protein n=1 Tax=Planctomicrobium sp. SH664 TaxID=3448125 RepID=UPI003F5C6B53